MSVFSDETWPTAPGPVGDAPVLFGGMSFDEPDDADLDAADDGLQSR